MSPHWTSIKSLSKVRNEFVDFFYEYLLISHTIGIYAMYYLLLSIAGCVLMIEYYSEWDDFWGQAQSRLL